MISGATRVAGVIGDPVRHSLSPALHNAAYEALGLDWVYVAYAVPAGQTAAALAGMRALDIAGLSVTMPHKEAAAGACDELSDDAAHLCSVNTVTRRDDGTLYGDSTDGEGFLRSLRSAGHDPRGATVAVFGSGGAARAVALALGRAGAHVTVVARRPEVAQNIEGVRVVSWADGQEVADGAAIAVNATPIGMSGDQSMPFVPRSSQVVADLVYHPLETPLLRAATNGGAPVVDGLGMLVHQAALQVEAWTGRAAPTGVMRDAAVRQLSLR